MDIVEYLENRAAKLEKRFWEYLEADKNTYANKIDRELRQVEIWINEIKDLRKHTDLRNELIIYKMVLADYPEMSADAEERIQEYRKEGRI